MRLLLDGSLSPSLVVRLADSYPDSMHVRTGQHTTSDRTLVQLAGLMDAVIVTTSHDFDDLALIESHGGRVLRLDTGPLSTDDAEEILRAIAPNLERAFEGRRVIGATRAGS